MDDHATEVRRGRRFEFGENWAKFLLDLEEWRITAAVNSLQDMLETADLEARSFLDIGCGSGLFSLAARRMGASVTSVDYDPESVTCAERLKRLYYPEDDRWSIALGSVLDASFIASLGCYDIVYSWGVLHHTGAMWRALQNAMLPVNQRGTLYISIYNDQGGTSRRWASVKRLYNVLPRAGKVALVIPVGGYFGVKAAIARAFSSRRRPSLKASQHQSARGMSWSHDLVDWVGGYPFEVATPESVFDFCRARGFVLARLRTDRGHGCNEFVFSRDRCGQKE